MYAPFDESTFDESDFRRVRLSMNPTPKFFCHERCSAVAAASSHLKYGKLERPQQLDWTEMEQRQISFYRSDRASCSLKEPNSLHGQSLNTNLGQSETKSLWMPNIEMAQVGFRQVSLGKVKLG